MKEHQNRGADQQRDRRGRLSLALAILALCLAVLSVCLALGRPMAPAETPVPSATVTPGDQPTATPEPAEPPAATPDRAEALNSLGVSTKGLTPEMAVAYAALIRAEQHPVVRAAMFDGGGVPMLWLAYGDAVDVYGAREALDGDYGDKVYAFLDGTAAECPWITSLLREGDDAVAAQVWVDYVSDLQDDFRLYLLKNGQLASEPFVSGTSGINGGTLNGQPVGEEEYLTLEDLYRMVDPELEILLDASSGLADMLFLGGRYPWLEGQALAHALLAYAG